MKKEEERNELSVRLRFDMKKAVQPMIRLYRLFKRNLISEGFL